MLNQLNSQKKKQQMNKKINDWVFCLLKIKFTLLHLISFVIFDDIIANAAESRRSVSILYTICLF